MAAAPHSPRDPLPAERGYSPLYYLAALGNGGLAVSFFIYLMFLVPHPETPIPTFETIAAALTAGPVTAGLVGLALVGVVWFAARHIQLMVWNLRTYLATQRRTPEACRPPGAGEVNLMAAPLAGAMSINVLFVLGALFVPGLWSVVEYLFPGALVGFGIMGWFALRILTRYLGRMLSEGGYRGQETAGFGQMIATFALVMVAVGFAAPASMSTTPAWVAIGYLGAVFFLSAAGILGVAWFVMGLRDVKEHGIAVEAAPSLWIVIPILTVGGIAVIRLSHGAHVLWPDAHALPGALLPFMTVVVSVQILFGLLGLSVMRRLGYFKTYLAGPGRSPGSYALICPGVAFMVFGMFFIHRGLVDSGLVPLFGALHLALLVPLVFVQARTIQTMIRLDRQHFRRAGPPRGTPASDDGTPQTA